MAAAHSATPFQIALAWLCSQTRVITIPMSTDPMHQRQNLEAGDITPGAGRAPATQLKIPTSDRLEVGNLGRLAALPGPCPWDIMRRMFPGDQLVPEKSPRQKRQPSQGRLVQGFHSQ